MQLHYNVNTMSRNIFTYGSLMYPQVWQRVVQGHYDCTVAIVSDFARYGIVGEIYPAMIAQEGASVSGIVYFDVDGHDIAILDAFESTDYRRNTVQAKLQTGEIQAVEAYIYVDKSRLSNKPWQPETFQLQHFLDTYCHIPHDK
jgi:gamma-glutamylcyclotransferase (GGCT)/AIG2-like uncharacterized protein YtfP